MALLDRLCRELTTIGQLTGDSLLDVSGRTLSIDNSNILSRVYNRKYCRFDRTKIVPELGVLVSEADDVAHLLADSRFLVETHRHGPPHALEIERMTSIVDRLDRLAKALDASQAGLTAQEQHYRKDGDTETTQAFIELRERVDTIVRRVEPLVANQRQRIAQAEAKTERVSYLEKARAIKEKT